MYIFGKDISEPVYFGVHYLEMYILGNEKLLDVYFRDKPVVLMVRETEPTDTQRKSQRRGRRIEQGSILM